MTPMGWERGHIVAMAGPYLATSGEVELLILIVAMNIWAVRVNSLIAHNRKAASAEASSRLKKGVQLRLLAGNKKMKCRREGMGVSNASLIAPSRRSARMTRGTVTFEYFTGRPLLISHATVAEAVAECYGWSASRIALNDLSAG